MRSIKRLFLFFIFIFSFNSFAQDKVWSLSELIEYAKHNNLTLQQAKLNNELLKNNISVAKRQKLPSINANISNNIVAGVSGIPISNSNQQNIGETNGYQLYQNSLSLGANIIVYNKGKLNLQEEKAELDFQVGIESLKANENNITLEILNLYLNNLLLKELEYTSYQQLKISQQQLERINLLYKNGAVPLSQVYEAKSKLAQDKQRYEEAKINTLQSLFNLAQLLQLDYLNFNIKDILKIPDNLDPQFLDVDNIIKYASSHQPIIKSAEIAMESAKKEVEITKTNLWPTISASYNVGTNYRDYFNKGIHSNSLLNQWWDNHSHSIGLVIDIPIFNKNINKLNIENQLLQVDIAKKKIEIEKQNLKQKIQSAYFKIDSNYSAYKAAKETVEAAKVSLEFAEKSLNAGKITLYDFNQSASALFNAKSKMQQAKYNYIFSLKVLDFYLDKPLTL